MLEFYWDLGRDISEQQPENSYGSGFYRKLSSNLQRELPDAKGFSPTNLKYCRYFYELYSLPGENRQQLVDGLTLEELFSIPRGHHVQLPVVESGVIFETVHALPVLQRKGDELRKREDFNKKRCSGAE